jgi:hypothetical protein
VAKNLKKVIVKNISPWFGLWKHRVMPSHAESVPAAAASSLATASAMGSAADA